MVSDSSQINNKSAEEKWKPYNRINYSVTNDTVDGIKKPWRTKHHKKKSHKKRYPCAVCGDPKVASDPLWYDGPACRSCIRFYMLRVIQQLRDKASYVCDNGGKFKTLSDNGCKQSIFCNK